MAVELVSVAAAAPLAFTGKGKLFPGEFLESKGDY